MCKLPPHETFIHTTWGITEFNIYFKYFGPGIKARLVKNDISTLSNAQWTGLERMVHTSVFITRQSTPDTINQTQFAMCDLDLP